MPASVFNVVYLGETATAQVPGTAQPENAEGFVIKGQPTATPERKQLCARVN